MEVKREINSKSLNDYYVSNYGNVYCVKNNITKQIGSHDAYGYMRVLIDGKYKKIHRLVAEYFIENFDQKLTVNHIDFNKKNNHVSNLEMMTFHENTMHYIINKKKNKSSSKSLGISYHLGINKWTARKNIDGKRVSLGVFDTEKEAIKALDSNDVKIGKGKSNIGKSKYTHDEKMNAVLLANEIGVRKAGDQTGLGSTQISILRKSELFGKYYIKSLVKRTRNNE